jgi:hypothetical protein
MKPKDQGGWQGPLKDCGEHVLAALRQLLLCSEVFRPFVVVKAIDSNTFVQFAGSTERGLLLDVPALNIYVHPCPTPEDGVNHVLVLLRNQGVPEDEVVHVEFESTRRAPGRSPGKA